MEKPERLRAVKLGLSTAMARLESLDNIATPTVQTPPEGTDDDLTEALKRLNLTSQVPGRSRVSVVHSAATVDLLNNAAVKFVHGDIEGDVYLEKLKTWAKESSEKIAKGESEIPSGLNQGDLYCRYRLSNLIHVFG